MLSAQKFKEDKCNVEAFSIINKLILDQFLDKLCKITFNTNIKNILNVLLLITLFKKLNMIKISLDFS